MRNLHKFYYKDYFSLDEVLVKNTNRRLDYELLIDDTKKKDLEQKIKNFEKQKKEAVGKQKEDIESQISEFNEQLAVNVNVLKVRNGFLIVDDYVKKDKTTRELLDEAKIKNDVSPNDGTNRFYLTISYPGLVTGVGINHEAKIEGEFKLGVHFDYTYGMPVVYGSSVKGALRAWFKDIYLEKNIGQEKTAQMLFDDIFNGIGADGKPKSIYDRDIFFDAVLVKADPKGRILCSDSITPHGDNPLRNPTPITFLKIAPGCEMEFRFKLVDTKDENGDVIFLKSQKKALFEEIIKTVGVGAKTNVGYGQFQ